MTVFLQAEKVVAVPASLEKAHFLRYNSLKKSLSQKTFPSPTKQGLLSISKRDLRTTFRKMKAILTAALIVCIRVGFSQDNLYKTGLDAYNTGKYEEAVTNLSEYLSKNSRDKKLDADAYYARGLAHYKNNRYTSAIDDFKTSIALGKKNKGNVHWLIGKCQAIKGDNYHAIESYTEALPYVSDSHKQAQLLFDRGIAFKKIQQKDLAEKDLKRVLILNPDHYLAKDALEEVVSSSNQALAKKSTDAPSAKRIALIIGNASYSDPVGHLQTPVSDALAFAEE